MIKRNEYTEEMFEYLKEIIPGRPIKESYEMFKKKFSIDMKLRAFDALRMRRGIRNGLDGQFKKGSVPFNKGKKIREYVKGESYEKISKTFFKKGNMPKNHRPVGSERICEGYVEIKVAEPNKWRKKHNVIWEEHNGAIPKGSVVIFLNKNTLDLRIENLMLVTRQELVRLNQSNILTTDTDLSKSAVILTKVKVAMYSKLPKHKINVERGRKYEQARTKKSRKTRL